MDKNLTLSDERARSVMKCLTEKGIAANRLSAQGYGPTQPLERNATPEGRERNQRVEFVIVPCRAAAP
jgi:OmpA-OmpF porin, OOP family